MKFETALKNVQLGSAIQVDNCHGVLKSFNKFNRAIVILRSGAERHINLDHIVKTNWVIDKSQALCVGC
ncbi:MAG: hypothetical protein ACRC4H_09430 [Plesiomonas sp.]